MASIEKRAGNWRALVRRKGIVQSATFSTKAEAVAWAAQKEAEILGGRGGKIKPVTLGRLLEEYGERVSPTKRGERWEQLRLGLMRRDKIAAVKLPELSAADFADWRDRRLQAVSAASVRREWNLLSAAINVAVKEWGWLPANPMTTVKRPAPPPSRERRISDAEIEAILVACGYDREAKPGTMTARVGAAMLFAVETAMRAGEIVRLADADVVDRVATVHQAKTLAGVRKVPLSPEALRLIGQMRGTHDLPGIFGLEGRQLDALFRKARDRAGIADLHFHDTRAEAITRLAKRIDILSLARMVGHRDLRMLQVYYRETAEELADRLA